MSYLNLAEQIKTEYELEHKANLKAVFPDDIPISYEAITPEWLTHILCKEHPDAKVMSLTLDVPDEGNTNRRRIYVSYNEAGSSAGLPSSVFCKAAHKLANRLVLANCGLTQGEVLFYHKYRPMLDIESPNCLLATFSEQTYNSIIVLDDLVRLGAEFCQHNTVMTKQRVESQLLLLAKMHGKFYKNSELKRSGLITFKDSFDLADKCFDLDKCCSEGFYMSEEVIPERLFSRYREIWTATEKAAVLHNTMPQTLTHNDTHLRNWYIAANGEMGSCDWQTFARGDWGRDVAYAISTALEPENRRAWERDLLEFYLEQFQSAGGPTINFNDAWRNYRRHLFDSLAWWTLTIGQLAGTPLAVAHGDDDVPTPDYQPREACLTFIGRMATAIDDLDALNSFD